MLDGMSPTVGIYGHNMLSTAMEDQPNEVYDTAQAQNVAGNFCSTPNTAKTMLSDDAMNNRRLRTHSLSSPTSLIDHL